MSDEELLRELRQAKDPAAHIQVLAELNGVAEAAMREYLRSLGADVPPPRRRKWTFDTALARALLAEGKTDLEAAEMLGVWQQTVGDWRRSQGLSPNRPPRKPRPPRPAPAPQEPAAQDPPAVCGMDLCGGADVVQAWAVVADGRPALYLRRREIAEAVQALIELDKQLREE